jgi:hypothetical protein
LIELQANVLFASGGDAMAPHFKLNPGWRGLTAHGSMVSATDTARLQTAPSPARVRAFLRA